MFILNCKPQGRCVVRKTVVVYMKTDSGMKEVCILEQGSTLRVVKQDEDGFCEVTSAVLKQIVVIFELRDKFERFVLRDREVVSTKWVKIS